MATFFSNAARVLACSASLVATARAGQITYSGSLPLQAVPWTSTITVPAFDPAFGILRQVTVTIGGTVSGSLSLENTNAQAVSVDYYPVTAIFVTLPSNSWFPPPNPAYEVEGLSLVAFDGTLDFQGPSSYSTNFDHSGGQGNPSVTVDDYVPAAMPAWIGPAGAPGNVQIALNAQDETNAPLTPGVAAVHTLSAECSYSVRYDWDPLPATICLTFGGSYCPCSGFPSSHGCPNSLNTSGASLSASGQASLSNDTLVLSGSGMTNSSALYFQGTSFAYHGTVFGDGVRCVGGTIARIGTKTNASGASSYPGPSDPPVSVRGGVTAPGTTRYYQVLYRDNGNFCTSATFNLTDGIALTWGS